MFPDDVAPTKMAGDAELVPCKRGGVQVLGIAPCHGDAPLKMHDLPRSTLPGPRSCEFAELGWRNIPPVDLQRGCSSHSEALSGIFRPPYADVLLEPFRPELEVRSLERRFERDLDLPLLEFKLD